MALSNSQKVSNPDIFDQVSILLSNSEPVSTYSIILFPVSWSCDAKLSSSNSCKDQVSWTRFHVSRDIISCWLSSQNILLISSGNIVLISKKPHTKTKIIKTNNFNQL